MLRNLRRLRIVLDDLCEHEKASKRSVVIIGDDIVVALKAEVRSRYKGPREYVEEKVFRTILFNFTVYSFKMRSFLYFSTLLGTAVAAGCPYMSGKLGARGEDLGKRQVATSIEETTISTQEFLAPFELNDTDVYMTTDSGTPIDEAVSLKAGLRGPTLLEDFIFRQKLQRFDHERVRIHLSAIPGLQINLTYTDYYH